jgi:alkylation response protein AidB-like acyl-CoA dehydrogenase
LERIENLRDVITDGGDRAQEMRRVPDDTVAALVDAGMFRFTLPEELGGENASVGETIEVLEAISAIDASVGWNVMLGSEINAMAVGGMDPALAKEVYLDNPKVIMCGGGGPGTVPSKAVRQNDGSFKVWGQSTFISGCHNAEWCFMGAPAYDGDDLIMVGEMPMFKLWFLHRSEWEIVDTWDVAGLRGSGSHDVKADGALVPEKWAGVNLFELPPHFENPVYRIPVPLRLAYNKAAVSLGIARGALNAFVALANKKTPMLSANLLKDRPIAQYRFGEAEATLRAARAYLFEAMDAVEEELHAGREEPGPETTPNGRLACIYAANASMQVVDTIHNTAGTSAMRMNNPLERFLRDSHGAATHRWTSHSLYPELGKIYMGMEGNPEFLGTGQPGFA